MADAYGRLGMLCRAAYDRAVTVRLGAERVLLTEVFATMLGFIEETWYDDG